MCYLLLNFLKIYIYLINKEILVYIPIIYNIIENREKVFENRIRKSYFKD